jgi:hypothetical protein
MLWRNQVFLNDKRLKEVRENMQDGPRSGQWKTQKDRRKCRQSTNSVRSDWRLDVRLKVEELHVGIYSEEKKTGTLAWQVDSPPWQRSCAWCVESDHGIPRSVPCPPPPPVSVRVELLLLYGNTLLLILIKFIRELICFDDCKSSLKQ